MKKEEIEARRFFVSGRVQGVGYRVFAQRVAEELGIGGFARNRHDGRVEVFAVGRARKLDALRRVLRKGPMMASVTDVSEEPASVDAGYAERFFVEETV
jgi:acylphosphatase